MKRDLGRIMGDLRIDGSFTPYPARSQPETRLYTYKVLCNLATVPPVLLRPWRRKKIVTSQPHAVAAPLQPVRWTLLEFMNVHAQSDSSGGANGTEHGWLSTKSSRAFAWHAKEKKIKKKQQQQAFLSNFTICISIFRFHSSGQIRAFCPPLLLTGTIS